MDALSRLLMLNAPQGTIDKNCVLGSDWQLPHGAGELSVIRWHALTQGAAKLEMPTGEIFTLRPGNVVDVYKRQMHQCLAVPPARDQSDLQQEAGQSKVMGSTWRP